MRTAADIDHAIHEEQALARVMHDAWNSDSADALDREMAERGHLLSAIEGEPTALDIAIARQRIAMIVAEETMRFKATQADTKWAIADEPDSLDYSPGGKHYPGNTLGWGWLFILAGVVLGAIAIARIGGVL